MKARLERQAVPALVIVDVSERPLAGGVMVPAALLNDVQKAQHALDRAEQALVAHLRTSGQETDEDLTGVGCRIQPPTGHCLHLGLDLDADEPQTCDLCGHEVPERLPPVEWLGRDDYQRAKRGDTA